MKHARNIQRSPLLAIAFFFLTAQLISVIVPPAHAAEIPSYHVQFIGGYPTAVNSNGQVVGWTSIDWVSHAWVFNGAGRELLPTPAGWHSQANDINDSGVIVGSAGGEGSPGRAVQWHPVGNGYQMTEINTPPTDSSGSAIAINNFGDTVGIRSFNTEIRTGVFTSVSRGFLLERDGRLTDNLSDINFTALPADINDIGQVIGGSLRLQTISNTVENLGVPSVPDGETRYTLSYLNATSNSGQVAATTVLASSLDANRTASRFTDGSGWQVLSFIGSYDGAYGINDYGTTTFEASFLCDGGVASPVVFLDGIGNFCIQDLLLDQNWVLYSANFNSDINNSDQIVLNAGNASTGEYGAVLLSPSGNLAPPSAPQNLAALGVETDAQQPLNAILLSWVDASSDETSFRLERRLSGSTTWNEIASLGSGTQSYSDTDIGLGIAYEYRVFSAGLAGDSAPSNVVAITSPNTTINPEEPVINPEEPVINPEEPVIGPGDPVIDTEGPVVAFVSPNNGDDVSGKVKIKVQATDNMAVSSVRIETLVNGIQTTICNVSSPSSDTVTCEWNTRKLASGIYLLSTIASDASGNFSSATIGVNLVASTKRGGKCNPKKAAC